MAKLSNLSLPISSTHFFNTDAPFNCRYDYCVLIGVVIFFRLRSDFDQLISLLQGTIELPMISHLMEGFLQLPALRCCVAEILVVLIIFVLVLEVSQSFNGLRSSENWTSLDFHKDIVGAYVETPAPLLISLRVLVWLSIAIFPRPLPILLMLRLIPCAYLRGLDKNLALFLTHLQGG